MSSLHFSENLIRLRRQRDLTQEQLASFIGVTKAAVSKWETGQSLPDILILPQLASYFDVTIDDLLDYRPQLSREQIRACYHKLAAAFAKQPFESVMSESEALVKKYYACYPFLLQICLLWLNHFMLAGSARRQGEILEQIVRLCDHILKHCDQIALCNDALVVRSMVKLKSAST